MFEPIKLDYYAYLISRIGLHRPILVQMLDLLCRRLNMSPISQT